MLRESKKLRASMRVGEAASLFDDDKRWEGVESARDRQELFDDYKVRRASPGYLRSMATFDISHIRRSHPTFDVLRSTF